MKYDIKYEAVDNRYTIKKTNYKHNNTNIEDSNWI